MVYTVSRKPPKSVVGRTFWPDERTEQLKALASQGHSSETIAQHIGVSRNAVIGRLNRLGIKLPKRPGGKPSHKPKSKAVRPNRVLVFKRNWANRAPTKEQIQYVSSAPVTLSPVRWMGAERNRT